VTVHPPRGWQNRIVGEKRAAGRWASRALAYVACEACADDAEMLGAGERAEAAGDFLFDLGHEHGTLADVVGERHGRIADEMQRGSSVQTEAA